jgi:hypothetical protein
MKNGEKRQRILFGIFLVLLSIFFYLVHFVVFRDAHHIFIYLIGDIAFVFAEVLLVTLIIHQLLSQREKRTMLKKLNMVIGAFFSETGTPLLKHFIAFDLDSDTVSRSLLVDNDWSPDQFNKIQTALECRDYKIDSRAGDLKKLQAFLVEKRSFLLSLLENQNLLEHEHFTELLWAVFHLAEELGHRRTVDQLSESDYAHLTGDIKRVHKLLIREWLSYMEHLKSDYPYLFSLAVRTNPFDPDALVEFK